MLVCKLRQTDMLSEYDAVISEQLEHEVVMKAPEKVERSSTCHNAHSWEKKLKRPNFE